MNRATWNPGGSGLRGLYRDRENGLIFGVCAGVADYIGISTLPVRIVAALALILSFVPTAVVYGVATLFLREKPLTFAGRRNEREFWRCRSGDHWSRP